MPEQNEDDFEDREAEVNRTLFLRGVHEKTSEDELYELFLQAGPLEKVAIPPNKNMAFVTFKHSVSAPYAKELFCDTRLHGRILNVDFRTGSIHVGGNNRQSRSGNHNNSQQQTPYSRPQHNPNPNQGGHNNSNYYGSQNQPLSGLMHSPVIPGMVYGNGLMSSPFMPAAQSMPIIQGYRSSADNREYVPQFVGFDSPPSSFMGTAPVNHPDHPVRFDERRQRLMNQQRYITQADIQRNQARHGGHRR